MSRREVYHEGKAMALGRDHVCGVFLQIWALDETKPATALENLPDDDNLLVNEDEVFDGLTRARVEQLAADHGFKLEEVG